MRLSDTFIDERAENFNQWLTQLAGEHGFALSIETRGSFSRCQVKRDNEITAELGIEPVGARLKLRPARLRVQYAPDRRVRDDFIEILDKALQKDYHAEPIERGESGSFTHWLWDGMENVKFDDPDEETRRQSFVAELARGLPALAPQSSAQAEEAAKIQEQPKPGEENSISTTGLLNEFESAAFSRLGDSNKFVVRVGQWLASLDDATKWKLHIAKADTIAKRLVIAFSFRKSGLTQERFAEQSETILGEGIPLGTLQDAIETLKVIQQKRDIENSG